MMRGEYYAQPVKQPEADKVSQTKQVTIDAKTLADMLPPDDSNQPTAVDAFGFGLSVKKDPEEDSELTHEEQQSVFKLIY